MKTLSVIAIILTLTFNPTLALGWNASSITDDMTSEKIYYATTKSENSNTLSWPYGTISAELLIRNHPRHGKDIIFRAEKGQIPCRSWAPCRVLVKFDDNKPLLFEGGNPSDGRSETVFIRGFDRFVGALTKAKLLKIEVEFYRNGSKVFVFDVSGFERTMLGPPKLKRL